ncbi:winged helix-turn-helix domain-containing protein [Paludibaculum fermentans]|uniref:Winged helix-turn-helix domain-containing protein n=1 Tax=Paludibaculum fermentans TaxID=1473598 RepID=A0A7S7NS32_PALFE|nr:winged helix-turn-helix domain-containing protein [Paludibaculum fermentans]QOY88680.1 winged helix-turn-helix domain-containing protein [Paludibaculum fermentans]
MLPVLRLVGDRKEHPLAEMRQRIADQLNLTEEELAERLASDSQTVVANRVAWAVQYLKSAGAIRAVARWTCWHVTLEFGREEIILQCSD